jgi:cell wall-associated NlpC family hydrolase
VLVLTGVAGAVLATVPAQAAPAPAAQPATSADAAALMAARAHELEKVTEAFDAARDQLAAQEATAKAAAARADQARAAQEKAREQVRGIARSAYTGQNGALQALLTSKNPTEFIDQVSTLQSVAGHQADVLGQAVAAGRQATAAQTQAVAAVTAARTSYQKVAGQQATLQAQVNAYQADFDRLSAKEKAAAVAAAEAGAVASARASRGEDRTATTTTPAAAAGGSSTGAAAPVAVPAAPGSAAAKAVSVAQAQRGKPYVWAAAGPNSFDCSGLVEYAYGAAGVSLPHSSLAQSQMGTPVSRDALQPGDLVFFYSPVSHVGIYIGGGNMVHAPTSGDVVKISPISVIGSYAGARRIG